jgi:hypothetical protein
MIARWLLAPIYIAGYVVLCMIVVALLAADDAIQSVRAR